MSGQLGFQICIVIHITTMSSQCRCTRRYTYRYRLYTLVLGCFCFFRILRKIASVSFFVFSLHTWPTSFYRLWHRDTVVRFYIAPGVIEARSNPLISVEKTTVWCVFFGDSRRERERESRERKREGIYYVRHMGQRGPHRLYWELGCLVISPPLTCWMQS